MIDLITPCEVIYSIGAKEKVYGDEEGICRITGKQSKGISFFDWVKDTFTDYASLKPGTIISNEALFCFDEASILIQQKTGKEKPQRFRTYSHIVKDGAWHCYTKAHKKQIYDAIISGAELICLTDSGQKHILFTHRIGFWQLDELFIPTDVVFFKALHNAMTDLMRIGFNQASIITGKYVASYIISNGADVWKEKEDFLRQHRGSPMFDLAAWMLFLDEEEKLAVKQKLTKPIKKGKKV